MWWILYYRSGTRCRESLRTTSLQIAKKAKRRLESTLVRNEESPLPTRTEIPEVLSRYVERVRTVKTPKSAQTDVYYLREAFGPICRALEITSWRVNGTTRKRPLLSGMQRDRRRKPQAIDAAYFEEITTSDIALFVDGQVRSRGLAPKTANRYREILCRLKRSQRGDQRAGWQPKTKKNRAVPISSTLRSYLERYEPRLSDGDWFFPSPEGKRWDADNFSRHLRAANKKAGLRCACLVYRHTFGSQLAQKGVSLYKISQLMGNSPEICRRHYAALIPEALTEEVEFATAKEGDDPGDLRIPGPSQAG